MPRPAAVIALVISWALMSSGASAADPVPLADTRGDADLALSGDSVVVGSVTRGGGWTVRVLGRGGRRTVLAPRRPRGRALESVQVAASPERIAALVRLQDSTGNTREIRLYSGAPAGPLQPMLRVRRDKSSDWQPIDVLIDGARLLLFEITADARRTRTRLFEPGTTPRSLPAGRDGFPVAFADGRVAFHLVEERRQRVAVVRLADGREEAAIAFAGNEDLEDRDAELGPGGRLLAALDGRLYTAAPGVGQRRLGRRGQSFTKPRFAGEDVVALLDTRLDARRPVLLNPATESVRALGSPSTDLEVADASPSVAAWIANRCVFATTLTTSPSPLPPRARCPSSEVTLDEDDQIMRGRRLRVVVTCVEARPACRGTVVLRSYRVAGRARFRVPAGRRRRVTVTFPPRSARRLHRRVRANGDALLDMNARVRDGRVSHAAGTGGVVVDRVR